MQNSHVTVLNSMFIKLDNNLLQILQDTLWVWVRGVCSTYFPMLPSSVFFLRRQERQCIHIDGEKVSSQTMWAFTTGKVSISCFIV